MKKLSQIAYKYDRNTFEYIGTQVVFEDPMEPARFDLPAYTTFVEPPELLKDHARVFDIINQIWNQVEDYRGTLGWLNNQWFTIMELGPLPDSFSLTPPTPTFETFRQHKIQEILTARGEAINAGITVNGIYYKTDNYSRTVLAQQKMYAQIDPSYSIDWQANDIPEFVTMNRELIDEVLSAMEQHVQPIFTKSKNLIADILNINPVSPNAREQLAIIGWDKL